MVFVPLAQTMIFVSIIGVKITPGTKSKGIFDNDLVNRDYEMMIPIGAFGAVILFIATSINIIDTKRFLRFGLEGIHANRPFTVGVKFKF